MRAPVVLDARVVRGPGGGPDKTILSSPRLLEPAGYRMLCAYMHHPDDPGFEHLRRAAEARGRRCCRSPTAAPGTGASSAGSATSAGASGWRSGTGTTTRATRWACSCGRRPPAAAGHHRARLGRADLAHPAVLRHRPALPAALRAGPLRLGGPAPALPGLRGPRGAVPADRERHRPGGVRAPRRAAEAKRRWACPPTGR